MYVYMSLHKIIHSQSSDYILGDDGNYEMMRVVVISYIGFYQRLNLNLQNT